MNPALRADQRGRLLDLIDRFFRGEAERAAGGRGPGRRGRGDARRRAGGEDPGDQRR